MRGGRVEEEKDGFRCRRLGVRHLWDVDVTGQVHSWGSEMRAWSGSTGQVSACPPWPQAWPQFAALLSV